MCISMYVIVCYYIIHQYLTYHDNIKQTSKHTDSYISTRCGSNGKYVYCTELNSLKAH